MNVDPHEVLWPDVPFRLHERLILAGLRGSEAHGTYVPPSDPHGVDDRDIMGVCVLPREYYLGLDRWEHAESIKECWDVVLWDTKNGAHLIRLLHMGHEYLTTGELRVRRREDVPHLLAIKRGEVALADVQAEAEEFFRKCHDAYDTSPLPSELDRQAVNRVLLSIFADRWRQT